MKEKLINFVTAELAKEKGFSEITKDIYVSIGILEKNMNIGNKYKRDYTFCTAPSQGLLQMWLREEHDIHISVSVVPMSGIINFHYIIRYGVNIGRVITSNEFYNTYEDALENALLESLILIK